MSRGSPAPWFRKSRKSWFVTLNGKQVDLQTADRKEATRRWHQLALNEPAEPVTRPQLTAKELFARFLEWAEKHTRPRSYEWYSYFLVEFATKLPEKLLASELRPFWVTRWLDNRPGWNSTSHHSAITCVKRAFSWGIQQGYFDSSPVASSV